MAGENDMDPELLDYDEEENPPEAAGQNDANGAETATTKKPVKGSYVSIHSSGFRDFLLKPELLRAIVDCGFEHPSEGETRENRRSCGFVTPANSRHFGVWCNRPYR